MLVNLKFIYLYIYKYIDKQINIVVSSIKNTNMVLFKKFLHEISIDNFTMRNKLFVYENLYLVSCCGHLTRFCGK